MQLHVHVPYTTHLEEVGAGIVAVLRDCAVGRGLVHGYCVGRLTGQRVHVLSVCVCVWCVHGMQLTVYIIIINN